MAAQSQSARSLHVWNILKVVLALLLALYVVSKTDPAQLLALRGQIDAGWLAAVIPLYVLLTLLKALQYYYLIGRQTPFPHVLNIVVIQNAMSNFVATSAGIASYLALFRVEQGVKLTRAVMALLLTKVGDLISIWLFLLVSSLLIWAHVTPLHGLIIILLTAIGGALLIFIAAAFLRQRFVSLLRHFLNGVRLGRIGLVSKGIDILQSLAAQDHGFVFRMVGMGIAFSLVYMTVTILWLYAGLLAFSFDPGLLPVVFVNTLIQLLSYLPIQVFGGLGVSETSMLYLYGRFGFPQTELAAVLIGYRLLFYLTNLLVLLYLPLHALMRSRKPHPVE